MPVRPVLRIPDTLLARRAAPVPLTTEADRDATRALCVDLLETMAHSPACVGLAANQIGYGLRAFAVDVTGHRKARSCHGPFVLLNPELLLAHGPVVGREGCMSVPDLTGDVARPTRVVIRGLSIDSTERIIEADAFEARAITHELDHLDGLLFLDRVTGADGVFRRKVYRTS